MSSKKDKKDKPKDKKKGDTPNNSRPLSPSSPDDELLKRKQEEEDRIRQEEERRLEEQRRLEEAEAKRREEEELQRQKVEAKRKEEERLERIWEERRKRKKWENEDDWDELSALSPEPESRYTQYNNKVYESFHTLTVFSRGLNTERSWQVPEVVFVGLAHSGKTSILEAILGHSLIGSSTKRPLHITMANNIEYEQPKITIRRDPELKEFAADSVVDLLDLPEELENRNIRSSSPIKVLYEYKYCWNITFIDTPGLEPEELKDEETIQKLPLAEIAKQPDRLLIFVEAATDWDQTFMLKVAEVLDPKLARSIFVYTKFQYQLKNFANVRDLNMYLTGRPPPKVKSYFVSLFSPDVRFKCIEPEKFKEKVEQAMQRDIDALGRLKYDHKHENIIGIQGLRKQIWELTWKRYQDGVPDLIKQLRTQKKQKQDKLEKVVQQIQTLDRNKLRSIATKYASDFLQNMVAILKGDYDANPHVNGQLLLEEKRSTCEWTDLSGKPVEIDEEATKRIRGWDTKLYGGQQFERLLAEFREVTNSITISDLKVDDIANSSGLSGFRHLSNHVWAASDLAKRKCDQIFIPLLKQLIYRAVYITNRIPAIIQRTLAANSKGKSIRSQQTRPDYDQYISMKDFPHFTWYIRSLFEDVVEDVSKSCIEKCMDELLCTNLVYWDYKSMLYAKDKETRASRSNSQNLDNVTADAFKKQLHSNTQSVETMAAEIFQQLQRRITQNVILKCYDNFLVKIQKTVTGVIQGQVACLSEEVMGEMFDLESTIKKLKEKEARLRAVVQNDPEPAFMEAASKFRL